MICILSDTVGGWGFMENLVLQIRGFREQSFYGSRRETLLQLGRVFETETLRAIASPDTGGAVLTELANFILRVRDVHGNMGERDAAYMLLWTWYQYFPEWALRLFARFTGGVGSWSDVRYLCEWLTTYGTVRPLAADTLRDAVLDMMLQQILEDHATLTAAMEHYFENRRQFFGIRVDGSGEQVSVDRDWKRPRDPLMARPCARRHVSLAAKWFPREKSRYGWLFSRLVLLFLRKSRTHAHTHAHERATLAADTFPNKAVSETARHLRKMVSYLLRPCNAYCPLCVAGGGAAVGVCDKNAQL